MNRILRRVSDTVKAYLHISLAGYVPVQQTSSSQRSDEESLGPSVTDVSRKDKGPVRLRTPAVVCFRRTNRTLVAAR